MFSARKSLYRCSLEILNQTPKGDLCNLHFCKLLQFTRFRNEQIEYSLLFRSASYATRTSGFKSVKRPSTTAKKKDQHANSGRWQASSRYSLRHTSKDASRDKSSRKGKHISHKSSHAHSRKVNYSKRNEAIDVPQYTERSFKDAQHPEYEDIYDEIYNVNYGRGRHGLKWHEGGRKRKEDLQFTAKVTDKSTNKVTNKATNKSTYKFHLSDSTIEEDFGRAHVMNDKKIVEFSTNSRNSFSEQVTSVKSSNRGDAFTISKNMEDKSFIRTETKQKAKVLKQMVEFEVSPSKKMEKNSTKKDKAQKKKEKTKEVNKRSEVDQQFPEDIAKKLLFSAQLHHFDSVQHYFQLLRMKVGDEVLMRREDIINPIVVALIHCHRISEAEQWFQWLYRLKGSRGGYMRPQDPIVLTSFYHHFARMGQIEEAQKYLQLIFDNYPELMHDLKILHHWMKTIVKETNDDDRLISFYQNHFSQNPQSNDLSVESLLVDTSPELTSTKQKPNPTIETFETMLFSPSPSFKLSSFVVSQIEQLNVVPSATIYKKMKQVYEANCAESPQSDNESELNNLKTFLVKWDPSHNN